ncbi:GntR family transcriptional regulator [Dongia mobilis]|uniref:GntR family transcriptional regulator n=1 Tax=Dongia mobilis TaxID=578943 RepID=A0A4R6WQF6_9PROT|nr:PLP-dependent aminotransferase family protein [Dongia mobilis]TDQ80513.1 GntR family transcriptional regulator [Dongia mobilis]
MTTWQPDLTAYNGPRYLAIADALSDDIRQQRVAPGTRLPTHRDLAFRLGVTVGTVTRAYAEAERRGLIGGEVGRGTFVRDDVRRRTEMPLDREAKVKAGEFIDLSVNFPTPRANDSLLAKALMDIAHRPGITSLLDYHHHVGLPRHRAAGAEWLGFQRYHVAPDRVIVTAGGQHAMTAALGAITEPGDVVLAESLTYPGLRRLADFLRIRLHGIHMDEEGVDPDAFEQACMTMRPKAFYCVANMHNPTGMIFSVARRRALAEIARKYGVKIVEDDVYGFLLGTRDIPPLSAFAPELGHYFTSVSKSMAPGLRVGYLAIPEGALDSFAQVVRSTTWMAAPLTAEIATDWVEDGTGMDLAEAHRIEAIARQRLARRILGNTQFCSDEASYHTWIKLPEPWTSDSFALEARMRGVGISPATIFALNRNSPNGVRLCLCAPADRHLLETALIRLAEILQDQPNSNFGIV